MTGSPGPNPYVFFVGCPRSGTTLLQRLANAHPSLAVTHETRWIARWYEKGVGLTADGTVSAELPSRVERHPRFKAFKLAPDDLWSVFRATEPATYAGFVTALFDAFAAARGKRLAGDKSPDYALHIPTLHALWPAARFVHIVRDGRDVGLSMLEWQKGAARFDTWRLDPLLTIAVWWEWHVRLAREAGAALGPALYHEIRYESLVEDTAAECRRLSAFLGLPFDERMLLFHEGRTRSDPALDAKHAWVPVTAGLRRWQEQMPAPDVERFEAAAGDLLTELGYTTGKGSPPAAVAEHAARIREAFSAEVRERRRALPDRWSKVPA